MSRELSLVSLSVIGLIIYACLLVNNQLRIDFERGVTRFGTMLTDVMDIVTESTYLIFVVVVFGIIAVVFATYRIPVLFLSFVKGKKKEP